jgi:uncharacterized cupredoxin-like copper-binding protein
MRTRLGVTAVLSAGLLFTACTGTDEEPSPGSSAETSEASSPADDAAPEEGQDAADSMDMSQPTAMIGEPADPDEATRTIEIDAFDVAFYPESITVDAGKVVTFEVTNTGEAVHEFVLDDAEMQQRHAEEMADMDGHIAHDEPNSISVEPGETNELTWKFGETTTLEYACHEPGHYGAGMHGELTVN